MRSDRVGAAIHRRRTITALDGVMTSDRRRPFFVSAHVTSVTRPGSIVSPALAPTTTHLFHEAEILFPSADDEFRRCHQRQRLSSHLPTRGTGRGRDRFSPRARRSQTGRAELAHNRTSQPSARSRTAMQNAFLLGGSPIRQTFVRNRYGNRQSARHWRKLGCEGKLVRPSFSSAFMNT